MVRQIIALGGGGFSMEPDNPRLDDFILARARRSRPRICFVGTASAEAPSYLVRFYRAFSRRDCVPTDLTLFDPAGLPRQPRRTEHIAEFVAEQEIIYVGGGNTANMLAMWRVHGVDVALRAAWEAGTILCGISAGMTCWFAASVTDSFGAVEPLRDGLGFLPFSACPHYDGEPMRRPRYHELIAGGFPAGYAADDGAALCFEDETLTEVVTSRPQAAGYLVELRGARVDEQRLPSRPLD